jgi:hypothetical protein
MTANPELLPEVIENPDRDSKGRFLAGRTGYGVNGKYPRLTNPDNVQDAITQYFEECETNLIIKRVVSKGKVVEVEVPEPYTMAGLAETLGIGVTALNNYKNRNHINLSDDVSSRIQAMITRARDLIRRYSVTHALAGALDPKISALVLSADFNMVTKTESTNYNVNRDMTEEELEDKIKAGLADMMD